MAFFSQGKTQFNRLIEKMSTSTVLNKQFIVRKQICNKYNISRSTLWRIESKDPTFPKPINLSIRKEQWLVDEVETWAASTRVGDSISSATGVLKLNSPGITVTNPQNSGKVGGCRGK